MILWLVPVNAGNLKASSEDPMLQAGTYIKEFVHGDEGRTVPNLGTLLGCAEPAKILQLDVLNVHMDFL